MLKLRLLHRFVLLLRLTLTGHLETTFMSGREREKRITNALVKTKETQQEREVLETARDAKVKTMAVPSLPLILRNALRRKETEDLAKAKVVPRKEGLANMAP